MKYTLFYLSILHMFDYGIKINEYVGNGNNLTNSRYKRVISRWDDIGLFNLVLMSFIIGNDKLQIKK